MSATSAAPVAMVFASSASATFPADKRSAIIPEPTTAATRNAVPRNSAATRLDKLGLIAGRSGQLLFSAPSDPGKLVAAKEIGRSCAPELCTLLGKRVPLPEMSP